MILCFATIAKTQSILEDYVYFSVGEGPNDNDVNGVLLAFKISDCLVEITDVIQYFGNAPDTSTITLSRDKIDVVEYSYSELEGRKFYSLDFKNHSKLKSFVKHNSAFPKEGYSRSKISVYSFNPEDEKTYRQIVEFLGDKKEPKINCSTIDSVIGQGE